MNFSLDAIEELIEKGASLITDNLLITGLLLAVILYFTVKLVFF